jgi:endonuclease YncB( thermonuclease family)/methylphosphotriester-DNA--protein-cysteine methyltransferase
MNNSPISFRIARWFLLALVLCASPSQISITRAQQPAPAATGNKLQLVIEGKVINVHDGDTITVLDQDNKKFHIRLQGIDAPELKQEFGAVSQQNLSRMVLGKQVTIVWTKVDKYRRTVGTIMLDGQDVNIEQVKAGLAWHFKKYEDEQSPEDRRTYSAAEQSARAAELGLWKPPSSPTAPGDWRQAVKAKRWGPPPPPGTIIGNSGSKKYHRPDCAGYRDMAERNRVFFKTVGEAEAAGYKRAGNCPPEEQVVAAHSVPARAIIQPIPTDMTPPQPSVVLPVMPQVTVPAPTLSGARTMSTPEGAKVNAATASPNTAAVTPRPGLSAPTTILQDPIIGNKNSKVYHLPGCSGYNRVSEKNQEKFKTAAEAEAAGYRLAKNCGTEGKAEMGEPKADTPSLPVTEAKPVTPTAPVMVPVSPVVVSKRKVIGNFSSKVYHFENCVMGAIAEDNRIDFPSAAVAEALGFRLAANCRETAQQVEPTSLPTGAPPPTAAAETKPAAPSAPATASVAPAGKIIGNKDSQIYHLPNCSGYTKVSEKNRVYFDSEADAEKAGYRKAKNCP